MVLHAIPVQNGWAGVSKNYEPDARYRYRRDSYTKGEIDTLLDEKVDIDDVYTKAESDALLDLKADQSDTYTKAEVDALVEDAGGEKQVVTVTNTSYVISESDKGKWLRFTSSDPVFVVWPIEAEFSPGNEVELFRVGDGPVTVFSEWSQDVRFNGKDDFRLNAKFSQVRAVNGDLNEWDCTYSGDVVFGVYQSPYYISDPGSDPSPIPWTPADASMALWLDASDLATITESAGALTQWSDKSGNGNTGTPPSAAARPATGTHSLNGLNVLTFAGDDYVSIPNAASIQLGTGDFFLTALVYVDNASKGAAAQNTFVSKSFNGVEIYNYQGTAGGYVAGAGSAPGTRPVSSASWFIATLCRTGTTLTMRVNGTAGSSSTNAGSASYPAADMLIGMRPGGTASQYLIGRIAEVLYSNDYASMTKAEGYAAWKWGQDGSLDAGHPYKSAPPTL